MNLRVVKGILLVAGTSIGGGMLALPVLTSLTGFLPSLLVYCLCWLFMTSTGLILLEICLWTNKETNIISLADKTLGKPGRIAAWILYLFLFYCLSLAYVVGCGDLVIELFQESIPEWLGSTLFLMIFAPMVYIGARLVGPINAILMVGLGVSYVVFVYLGVPHIKTSLLTHQNWSLFPTAFPIAFTAFAYQGIIPTLVHYMHRDAKQLRTTIIIGSFLPLLVYTIWQALILGIVPLEGPHGLMETLKLGENAVLPLRHFLDNPNVYVVGQFFAFFALVTSFLGVTLALVDFLADGLAVKKDQKGKLLLCGLIFVPTLIISFIYPGIFLIALDFAGGLGCALLLGMLPILMAWSGRYWLGFKGEYSFWGGKPILVILMAFVLFELGCQAYITFNF